MNEITKICNRCFEEKSINYFPKRYNYCKKCRNTAIKNWRHINGIDKRYAGEPRIDYTGQMFGLLTVISWSKIKKHHQFNWVCLCKCGNTTEIITGHLKKTKSCGCLVNPKGSNSYGWKGIGEISGCLWTRIKQSAARRHKAFSLTKQYCWDLYLSQDRKCGLSGAAIGFAEDKNTLRTASLDRINNSIGYIEGNVRWVHRAVNYMRQSLTDEELIDWCKKIVEHNR